MNLIDRQEIFREIEKERDRQDKLHPMPKNSKTEDENVNAVSKMFFNNEYLAVLVEEVGEIASALQGDGILKDELIQVASCAVRWLENLD